MKEDLESAGLSSPTSLTSLTTPNVCGGREGREGHQRRETALRQRLLRRLRSTRGSAYLEFACVMPLVVATMCFAADFMRCLYVEQQVEISSRALCDIESHLKTTECPRKEGKQIVDCYLKVALKDAYIKAPDGKSRIYCRGAVVAQSGLIQTTVNGINNGLKALESDKNAFVRLLGKFITGVVKFVSMNTLTYVSNVVASDRVVKTSVSAYVRSVIPREACYFGQGENWYAIPAYAPRLGGDKAAYDRPLLADRRVRYYCYMPHMDTCALAQTTYIRDVENFCAKIPLLGKWLKTGK